MQWLSPQFLLAMQHRWGDSGADYRIQAVLKHVGASDVVVSGPFAGMQYVREAAGSCLYAKTLGTYEIELHDIIKQIVNVGYQLIIDVGCAEGYYAVGLALKMATAKVVAFDSSPTARRLCGELAALNGCQNRVDILGECIPSELSKVLRPNSLLICDCEGFELELLKTEGVPLLAKVDMLIELHDCFQPGLSETLLPRFESTHSIQVIHSKPRVAGSCDSIKQLKKRDQEVAMFEERPGPMSWAWMKVKIPW